MPLLTLTDNRPAARVAVDLAHKIQAAPARLQEVSLEICSGIFVSPKPPYLVNRITRNLLAERDAHSREILKPYIDASDLQAWRVQPRAVWIIDAYSQIDIQNYPAVYDYLLTFRPILEKRPSVKEHPWYELSRFSPRLRGNMSFPKLLLPGYANSPRCAFDENGFYADHDLFMVLPDQEKVLPRFVQGVLGSKTAWFYIRHTSSMLAVAYFRLTRRQLMDFPFPQPGKAEQEAISTLVEKLAAPVCVDRFHLEAELNQRVASLYGIQTADEFRLLEGLPPIGG